jgi:hypothetical protein
MNPGLRQGFVKFDTLACKILKHMYVIGDTCCVALQEDLQEPLDHVSVAVCRLVRNGFIYDLGKRGRYEVGGWTRKFYSLKKPEKVREYKALPRRKITAAYAARRKVKVPDVFNFRGKIKL